MNVAGGNGTIYLLNLSGAADAPGVAGDDSRVLVMQITTEGDISGSMNALVYPNGLTQNALNLRSIRSIGVLTSTRVSAWRTNAACATALVPFTRAVAPTFLKAIAIATATKSMCSGCAGEAAPRTRTWTASATTWTSAWACWMRAGFATVLVRSTVRMHRHPDGDCDCDGNQLGDRRVREIVEVANNNGICDVDEIEGCTDTEA